jgi:hypothetical protein
MLKTLSEESAKWDHLAGTREEVSMDLNDGWFNCVLRFNGLFSYTDLNLPYAGQDGS